MKKYLLILIVALSSCLTGCKKEGFILPDPAFTEITAKNIQSDAAWADVIPANNDFYYAFFCFTKEVWEAYGSPERCVELLDEGTRTLYEQLKEEGSGSFQEECLYRGAYYVPLTGLTPDTEYCLFAYPYDENIMAVKKVSTCFFKTPKAVVSDIRFSIDLTGNILSITPTNNDSYFWWWDKKENIEKEAISADYYYRSLVKEFWEHDMFPDALSCGEESDDMSKYYELKDGDQFYVMASGYEGGISSDVFTQLITYKED